MKHAHDPQRVLVPALKLSPLVAVLLALLAPFLGSASAAETSPPAAASWNSNRYDLIIRGHDGLIYHKYWNGSAWIGWGSIGAPPVGAASAPTVAAPEANVLQVFVRGGDNRLWNNHYTHGTGSAPGGWSGWGAVPNTGNITYAPATTFGKDNQPDVFYRGTDGSLYYTRYDPVAGWIAPVSLGGVLVGSPSATTTVGGRMQVVVRGTDNRMYLKFADSPNGWTGWGALPNAYTNESPVVTTADEGQANIFFKGTGETLYHQYWNPNVGWIGPGHIPGNLLTTGPTAARLHVYYRNASGNVMDTWYHPIQNWTPPASLGQPNSDGTIKREQNNPAVYYMADGVRYWITSPEVAAAAGLNPAWAEILPPGSFNSIPRGVDMTMSDFTAGWNEPDPGTATAASGWSSAWGDTDDDFDFMAGDGRAKATGTVRWYYGSVKPWLHRGDFTSGSYVTPHGHVPCIWAQVRWAFPKGSVSYPPSGSISGAEERSNMFVKCRSGGYMAPDALPLRGLGHAAGGLGASTLTICTSNSKAEGPRYCSNHQMEYPPFSP